MRSLWWDRKYRNAVWEKKKAPPFSQYINFNELAGVLN